MEAQLDCPRLRAPPKKTLRSLHSLRRRSPHTGDGDGPDGPGVLPHDVVLRQVVAGREVLGGPLAGGAGRAGELVRQVLVRLAGCADPAAVLAWEPRETTA